MAVTARFHVSSLTQHQGGTHSVVLTPDYANGANKEWSKATPTGKIELGLTNPDAVATFQEWLDASSTIEITMEGRKRVTS